MKSTIDLESLVWFASVVEAGNFSAAARILGVSRQVMQRRVAGLEEATGLKLFDRTTRKVVPTDLGLRLYEHAVAARGALKSAEELSKVAASKPQGKLRVMAPPLLAEQFLVPVSVLFSERFPEVNLEILLDTECTSWAEKEIDLAICTEGTKPDSFFSQSLRVSEVCWVASPRMASIESLEHPSRLRDFPVLVYKTPSHESIETFEMRRGSEEVLVSVKPRICVANGAIVLEAARRGLGVVRMPRVYVEKELRYGTLIEVLKGWAGEPRPVRAVYPSRMSGNPSLVAFLDTLKEHWDQHWKT